MSERWVARAQIPMTATLLGRSSRSGPIQIGSGLTWRRPSFR